MKFTLIKAAIATAMLVAFVVSGAGAQPGALRASYAAVGSETSVPYGWVDF